MEQLLHIFLLWTLGSLVLGFGLGQALRVFKNSEK